MSPGSTSTYHVKLRRQFPYSAIYHYFTGSCTVNRPGELCMRYEMATRGSHEIWDGNTAIAWDMRWQHGDRMRYEMATPPSHETRYGNTAVSSVSLINHLKLGRCQAYANECMCKPSSSNLIQRLREIKRLPIGVNKGDDGCDGTSGAEYLALTRVSRGGD